MNELQVFNSEEFGQLRTTVVDGNPWFVGKDAAERLGYTNPQKAVRDHVDEEDKGVNKMETPSGEQQMVIINESGLYALIFSSKMPTAKKFKRWITSEVLPAIRKTGKFSTSKSQGKSFSEMVDEYWKMKEKENISIENVIECAKIMASCPPENRMETIAILRHCIPDIDRFVLLNEYNSIMGKSKPKGDGEVPAEETNFKPGSTTIPELQLEKMSEQRKNRAERCMAGCMKPFDTEKLNEVIAKSELDKKQIVMRVGCSDDTFYRWMKGETWPSTYYRVQLCSVLGVPEGHFNKPTAKKKKNKAAKKNLVG